MSTKKQPTEPTAEEFNAAKIKEVDAKVAELTEKFKCKITLMIQDAETREQLIALESFVTDDLLDFYNAKLDTLKA